MMAAWIRLCQMKQHSQGGIKRTRLEKANTLAKVRAPVCWLIQFLNPVISIRVSQQVSEVEYRRSGRRLADFPIVVSTLY